MFREQFQGIPTKPILIIAPLMIVVALALHYHSQYKHCKDQAMLREQLHNFIKNNINQTISLADAVPLVWDKAFVLLSFKPDRNIRGCPFGWDWSEEHRNSLIGNDLLNVIFYTLNKKRVTYIEFSDQQITFEGVDAEAPLTPDTTFTVESKDGSNQQILLIKVENQ